MKRIFIILLNCVILCALTACVDFSPSDCPYGVWKYENHDLSFTLDINPQVNKLASESGQGYSKLNLYPGEYQENGETIEVYVSVFDPTNMLDLFYINNSADIGSKEKKGLLYSFFTIDGVAEAYSDDMVTLLVASYHVIDGRLRLQLTKDYKEKFETDYLYLDLVQAYEIPGKNDDQSR